MDPTLPPAPYNRTPGPMAEMPKLDVSVADAVAESPKRYFNPAQFAALRKLSEILMPAINDAPGALEAGAPEFLDFLLSESPADRQTLYKSGLDGLNAQAKKQFGKAFADVSAPEAVTLMAPLKQQWSFVPPADTLARFLWAAKQDVRAATLNSREYSTGSGGGGGRRGSGTGLYWSALD